MTLVIVDDNTKLELPQLFRLALKKIYESKKLTFMEERKLHKSVIQWNKYLEFKKDISLNNALGAVDEEYKISLEVIGTLLHEDDEGLLDKRKETFKRHGIDYRKFYRLPEAFTPEDFKRGQETLEKHKQENPEDYA